MIGDMVLKWHGLVMDLAHSTYNAVPIVYFMRYRSLLQPDVQMSLPTNLQLSKSICRHTVDTICLDTSHVCFLYALIH